MKIINLYSDFVKEFEKTKSISKSFKVRPELEALEKVALEWGIDLKNVENWLRSAEYKAHHKVGEAFIAKAQFVVSKVEKIFGVELKGEVRLSPSLMFLDGFARYDKGSHTVMFGVDHPDADEDYLSVLMAHELSHVYRDHQPDVWGFLGKPLNQVSRQEYLDSATGLEHLASEGLATVFSQVVYPEVPLHVHHYYIPNEMTWCLENTAAIGKAIQETLRTDDNVWKFYEDDSVAPGSPSRVQYYWAALKIREWLESANPKSLQEAVVKAHSLASSEFACFK